MRDFENGRKNSFSSSYMFPQARRALTARPLGVLYTLLALLERLKSERPWSHGT